MARRATIEIRRSLLSVGEAKASVAVTSSGISRPPIGARSIARRKQVGSVGHGRQTPGEHEGKVKLVGRIDLVGKSQYCVFEGEQRARIDVEFDVQIDRSAASVLGVKVNFPRLAQGVCLDEVALVVDVKAVSHRMVFKVGDETCDVNGGHYHSG